MININVSASEVSLGAGFVAMESAGTAIQLFGGFENVRDIGQGAETEGRHCGAEHSGYRCIHGRGKVQGCRVIDKIHPRMLHQCGGFEEGKLAGEIYD